MPGFEPTTLCFRISYHSPSFTANGKEATVNRALDGSTYPSLKVVHSVFGKINYGGLKHNSLYLGLVLPSGGWQCLIQHTQPTGWIGLIFSYKSYL